MTEIVKLRDAQKADSGLGSLLFYSQFDDPREWSEALARHLPTLDFRVFPEIGDPADIRYVLAWKPPDGFFAPFRNLQLVVNLGAGVDSLTGRSDLPEVPIARLSDPGMVAMMKSYVFFAVIRYARDMPEFEAAKRRREWHYIHPRPLDQTKVGIVGLGALGSPVAAGLAELGFDVLGFDHMRKTIDGVRTYAEPKDWRTFLGGLDILVNMMPLTPLTRGMIDADVFAALPRGAKFVNASRGEIVDEAALIDALRSGQIGGATLDVFPVEPLPPDHPYWTMENVYITPHLASITVPAGAAPDVAESIRRVNSGRKPLNQVNPQAGY
jgi:glyoxylate/hydroxypyruvate reductase A